MLLIKNMFSSAGKSTRCCWI